MQDVFTNPPATVGEVCELYHQVKAIQDIDKACAALDDAIAFASTATAGRILARVPKQALTCNDPAPLLQALHDVLDEAQRVCIEATHRMDRRARSLDS
jgi:hypothetical protein